MNTEARKNSANLENEILKKVQTKYTDVVDDVKPAAKVKAAPSPSKKEMIDALTYCSD